MSLEIDSLFNSFNKSTILVVGDSMIDSYVWGKIDRMSPEAPVPLLNVTKKESRIGGAANVALNLKALGAKRVVPQSAEPFFHVCITRRFSPGRKLQSAAAPRTPQALGQHSCTLSVGADRARPTPRG